MPFPFDMMLASSEAHTRVQAHADVQVQQKVQWGRAGAMLRVGCEHDRKISCGVGGLAEAKLFCCTWFQH